MYVSLKTLEFQDNESSIVTGKAYNVFSFNTKDQIIIIIITQEARDND